MAAHAIPSPLRPSTGTASTTDGSSAMPVGCPAGFTTVNAGCASSAPGSTTRASSPATEEFDFDHARGLKRDTIAHLGTLDFVTARENVELPLTAWPPPEPTPERRTAADMAPPIT